MRRALVVALALAALSFAGRGVASAQTTFQVATSTAQLDFPNGINFTLTGTAGGSVEKVRLNYRVAPDGVRASAVVQCTSGASITCGYELVSSPANLLIPGAELTYSWDITVGGATQTTPDQQVVYQDTRFDFKAITEGNMTLWYYSGSEDAARAVLDAGYGSEQSSSALLQTTVDYPVKLFYYASAQEMQPALQANNAVGVITLGEVVYSDTAMVSADASPMDIARHEVAHLVQRAALPGAYNAPDWLTEGMAVYEQSQPIGDQREAIDSAIRSGHVLSVRSMSSASSGGLSSNVLLFYGEAWSLAKFLIDTYGDQKFADLYRAIGAGDGTPGALQQVYGFNEDGLENAWRASVGLPPREVPTPADSANAPAPTNASSNASAATTNDSGSSKAVVIAIVIAATAMITIGLLGLGVLLARRYR